MCLLHPYSLDSGQSLSRSSEALPAHPVLDAEKLECHGWHGAGERGGVCVCVCVCVLS